LEWLHEGANRVGSAADNDIVLKAGPAHLGVVTVAADGTTRIALAKGVDATIDGQKLESATLVDDMHVNGDAAPTTVRFGHANF
ncbi:hypothetical protein, partial [Salmonella sp. hn-h4]|uniref:hypothetical protein n=1 Tax=Salmonella sp. hn-h4 TaxID=2582612 RepID=UPI0013ABDB16